MTGPKEKALVPEVIDPAEDFSPVVDGKRVTPKQMEVFRMWLNRVPNAQIESRLGLSKGYVKMAKCQLHWFKRLMEQYFDSANEDLFREIVAQDKSLAKSYTEIIKGKRAGDKSTMSQARLMELRIQMGNRPILNKRGSSINIQQNISGGSGTINLGEVGKMSSDEWLEYHESGNLPDRVSEGNG